MSHQQFDSSTDSDMDMRLPQETVVRGSPSPKKLSVDSVIIACPMAVTTIYIMEEMKFGSRCFFKIYPKSAPMVLAARI